MPFTFAVNACVPGVTFAGISKEVIIGFGKAKERMAASARMKPAPETRSGPGTSI
ncbi:MAG: hypothetical protein ICV82_09870 [Nitrososphaera sp.]|nr:hypothetical protein [Nitrososphaera sp.]